jgi:hypothetical protein
MHPDGAKSPTNLPYLGKVVFSSRRMRPIGNERGFFMISRRDCLIGASAALMTAPAIVRAGSLMPVRSVIIPSGCNYYGFVSNDRSCYGFCDRLAIDWRYRSGALRGPALIRTINEGLLRHIPPDKLVYDLARWGTTELSLTARDERTAILWPRAKERNLGPYGHKALAPAE